MIKLYRKEDCKNCREIEDKLKELVLAHQVIIVGSVKENDQLPDALSLPALLDDNRLISGSEAIREHLQKLEKFVGEWRKYQSDVCYVDEEGEIC